MRESSAPVPDAFQRDLPLPDVLSPAALPLVDHHCHGVTTDDLDRPRFEAMLTEAGSVSPLGTTLFDSLLGLAVRRWCAPVLGLPPHAPAADYLARRAELGAAEATRRLVAAAGIAEYLVDTGLLEVGGARLGTRHDLAGLSGGRSREIVRLEQVGEDVARAGGTAAGYAEDVRRRLAERTRYAAGVKSVAAYRAGLALPERPPATAEVRAAAGRLLAAASTGAPVRITDPVLHGFLAWQGIELAMPLQVHVGYGDADLDLARADPASLTGFLRATAQLGVPVSLLHNYPFHRHAAYLAQVFPQVFADVSLATHNTGRRSTAVLAETLELAPFGKVLFGSDACGLGELFHLGAWLFRRALGTVLAAAIDDGDLAAADAPRIARLLGRDNARRAYRLTTPGP